jgi:DNA-directed RNA polymerase subunit RPC12/RpoP
LPALYILGMICTFPLGLLLLFLPRPCKCQSCGAKFEEGSKRPTKISAVAEGSLRTTKDRIMCPHCNQRSAALVAGLQGMKEIIPAIIAGVFIFVPAWLFCRLQERLPYCGSCNRRIAKYPLPIIVNMVVSILLSVILIGLVFWIVGMSQA